VSEGPTLDAGATALSIDPVDGGLWACGEAGLAWHVAPTGEVTAIPTGLTCYGPPLVDVTRDRVLIPGYLESQIAIVDRTAHVEIDRVDVPRRPLTGVMTVDAVWLATGVDDGLLQLDPETLDVVNTHELGGQTTDVWFDAVRGDLWAAVYGLGLVVRVDAADGAIRGSVPVAEPFRMRPVGP
jgi:hypothetical protein